MNGVKIKTDDPCDLCGKQVSIGGTPNGKENYNLYTYGKKRVCKLCAKKLRVL